MEKIHIRLSGFVTKDTTHPEFMEDFKAELEKLLTEKGILYRPWVTEITIGKEVRRNLQKRRNKTE